MDVCLQMDVLAVKNETCIFNYAGKEKKSDFSVVDHFRHLYYKLKSVKLSILW